MEDEAHTVRCEDGCAAAAQQRPAGGVQWRSYCRARARAAIQSKTGGERAGGRPAGTVVGIYKLARLGQGLSARRGRMKRQMVEASYLLL